MKIVFLKRLRADSILGMLAPFSLEYFVFPSPIKIKIYITMILPIVLYGYETFSFTLRD
jgi:hypothetical protein